jgi:hypothetical protein
VNWLVHFAGFSGAYHLPAMDSFFYREGQNRAS